MEPKHAEVDRIESYYDDSHAFWVSLKTPDEYLELDLRSTTLRTWSDLRKAVKREYGIEIMNPTYENPGRWEMAIMSARFRGAQK